ncbi:uncharacterized protein BO96DRAFT_223702 [Aspergillus niger CBS 101883]|uniref:uncharacterized protein n=1 Tax=Aspergillus lacticoffeatus (strain CBS 101883) TaxID=1450533 RepID=UPI000D801E27|nr:uncharacterized protein BO96DRAFT_223702 [Aspergillus niger CBS 101883]PYH50555.1 hypothetical protein BO96DRAFT_223702 [Aspergillus niger CBS 101883]
MQPTNTLHNSHSTRITRFSVTVETDANPQTISGEPRRQWVARQMACSGWSIAAGAINFIANRDATR